MTTEISIGQEIKSAEIQNDISKAYELIDFQVRRKLKRNALHLSVGATVGLIISALTATLLHLLTFVEISRFEVCELLILGWVLGSEVAMFISYYILQEDAPEERSSFAEKFVDTTLFCLFLYAAFLALFLLHSYEKSLLWKIGRQMEAEGITFQQPL